MSFILEALKKSEQQRQQNAASPKQVGARRLSLHPRNSRHRPYWLLVTTVLLLLMLGGWWHFSASGPNQGDLPVVERVESPPPAKNRLDSPKPAVIAEPDNSPKVVESATGVAGQADVQPVEPVLQPRAVVETAPVPRSFIRTATSGKKAPSASMTQSGTIIAEGLTPQKESSTLPLYTDLSTGLRERMPRLDMSMHFYTSASERRLVRINNRLLREGDWVSGEVEIVEITPTGVILDFLGKDFKLSSAN
ncbi:MAG: general secretion pathway protein GspB [Desulfuromonadales bacterium]|jgi:general secretion pathway protein B|nr:general secretion pathway protein GspB [Desulfuromonadales bacterium]